MVSKEEFREYCKSLIPKEELEAFERQYKTRAKMTKGFITCGIIIAILVFGVATFITQSLIAGIVMTFICSASFALVAVIILAFTSSKKHIEFKEKYAEDIIKYLLTGYKHSYNPTGAISDLIFINSRFGASSLFGLTDEGRNFDDYRGEDLLKVDIPKDDGTPSGVELQICDLHVTREEERTVTEKDSDGRTRTRTEKYTVTVYDGVFGYVHFPFKFKCRLGLNKNLFNMKRIQLEDIKFNQKFRVFTDNQLEAVVIMTPTLMTKLMEFSKKVNGFEMYLSPEGDMYFRMSRNLFSLKVANNHSPIEAFDRFYDDIYAILSMVNEIKDNNKVFKM